MYKSQTCKELAWNLHCAVPDLESKRSVGKIFDDDIRMFKDFRAIELVCVMDGGQLLFSVIDVVVDHRRRPDEVILEDCNAAQGIYKLARRQHLQQHKLKVTQR